LDSWLPKEYVLSQDDTSAGTLEEDIVLGAVVSVNRDGTLEKQGTQDTAETPTTQIHTIQMMKPPRLDIGTLILQRQQ